MLVAVVALATSASVGAVRLDLRHPYGELVNQPGAVFSVVPHWGERIDCLAGLAMTIEGRVIKARVRRLAPGVPETGCSPLQRSGLDALAVGWWTGVLEITDSTGSRIEETITTEWRVDPPDTNCNAEPFRGRASLIGYPRGETPHGFAQRVHTDVELRARLGEPAEVVPSSWSSFVTLEYPAPENPHDLRAMLERTGELERVHPNHLLCFATPPGDRSGRVIEYYHAGFDTYFYTVDADEAALLDAGEAIKGWTRTGLGFDVLVMPGCPIGRKEQAAYRFWGKPGVGPSSHVFTVQRDECRIVHKSGAWLYESSPFWATPPNSRGACTDATELALHRLWRPWGESNHRFTTDGAVVEQMQAKGWIHEGVRMCVRR